MNKENILGFNVCNTDFIELINNIFQDFDNNISNFIVNINPEIIINNYKDKKILEIFNKENYQIPDGIGIIYASKVLKKNLKQRIPGIDLMTYICNESINHNSKIFLYGGKDGIADKAKKELEILYPNINIVGTCNGYTEEDIVLDVIKKSNPNILFVGLGSPKQEQFIINHRNELKSVKIFMPIGGSLDVISKSLKRAPHWIIKYNLEWLYRAIKEPRRFLKHLTLIKFIFLLLTNNKKE